MPIIILHLILAHQVGPNESCLIVSRYGKLCVKVLFDDEQYDNINYTLMTPHHQCWCRVLSNFIWNLNRV